MMGLNDICILGNSLGGHVGLVYTLRNPVKVRSLILTGGSGLSKTAWAVLIPKE